jgi:transcription elongation factor GreA
MSNINYFTPEGYKKLVEELHYLKTVERPAISRMIAEAREKGDLSENAEYDAAKNAQGLLELKISQLEEMLSNARILDESKIDTSRIMVLTKVRLLNMNNNQEVVYTLVAEKEANFKAGKISVTSPIGKGLLGRRKEEIVEIQVPSGKLIFKILEISR